MPVIDWNLAWTIACGIIIGFYFLHLTAGISAMWQDNWKVTVLIILHFACFPLAIAGALMEFFGWIWLVPAGIVSLVCFFVATELLVKEKEGSGDFEHY